MFKELKTEEDAYWFGYLMADGYNHISGKVVQFTQAEQDKEMVYRLKDYIGKGSITIIDRGNPDHQVLYMLSISSKELSENLTNLGCENCKSLTMKMPNIPPNLYWHFIRGYFDGDGCLYSKIRESDNCLIIESPIVCSNDFASSFSQTLTNNGIKHYNQKLGKNKLCTTIKITGIPSNCMFYDLMYNDATIYSPRKMNLFKTFVSNLIGYDTWTKKIILAKEAVRKYHN